MTAKADDNYQFDRWVDGQGDDIEGYSGKDITVEMDTDKTFLAEFTATSLAVEGISAGAYNTDQSFTIESESEAAVEYSLDGGSKWSDYEEEETLSSEGSYDVQARQIDEEGNTLNTTSAISVIIDKIDPDPGDNGTINIDQDSVTVNWTKAEDNETEQADLQYKGVYSTEANISTVAEIEDDNNGTVAQDWTADQDQFTVSNFRETYHFNVVTKDEAGNKEVYDSQSEYIPGWQAVGTAGFSDGRAQFTDIAFNSNDTPYVVYQDLANDLKATVKKYDESEGSWSTVGTAGFSDGDVVYADIAFDSSDTPYVVYQDAANGDGATVMDFK